METVITSAYEHTLKTIPLGWLQFLPAVLCLIDWIYVRIVVELVPVEHRCFDLVYDYRQHPSLYPTTLAAIGWLRATHSTFLSVIPIPGANLTQYDDPNAEPNTFLR